MKEYLKEKAHQLPLTPGVYLMKDATDTIIYVGKAKKLKNRVSSYFINSNQHSRKTMRLVKQIIDFDVLHPDTELDALLLECQLIQQYRPRYNRQMNAYEQYSYVSVAVNERQLEIKLLNIPTKENCFGPYSIRRKLNRLKIILDSIYDLVPTNYWHQTFQKESAIPTELFQQELFDFFHNQGREPIKRIAQQMQEAAEKQAFEKAAKLKEDWLFLTRFANQTQRISQANQRDWQLMWLPCQKKIKYSLIYQGLVVATRVVTKQTFQKYSPLELAKKIMPKKSPKTIEHYSKQQVDFLNILYGYISRHPECHLENLTIEKA